MRRIRERSAIMWFLLAMVFCFSQSGYAEEAEKAGEKPAVEPEQLTLVEAVVCEGMKDLAPFNEAIVFSVGVNDVICFTAFDPVPEKTVIYHHWFNRDQSEKKMKLTLKPPKWSSFSKISIRNVDVGPWRVEIVDAAGKVLRILRFSVTE